MFLVNKHKFVTLLPILATRPFLSLGPTSTNINQKPYETDRFIDDHCAPLSYEHNVCVRTGNTANPASRKTTSRNL